jgi:glycosyltransferase involved in cell wall biosynthesis
MKILSFTAGAASMYCGSCIRDNALAAELMRRGHDVTLMPIYTPTLTDEPNVSRKDVVFGGISVYLQQYSTLFRHTPWLVDRIWDSRLALKAASKRSIPVNPKLLGELTVSMLEGQHGVMKKEFAKLLRWLSKQPAPDVINLPNSMLIAMAAAIRKAFERPVLCTLAGDDLFLDGLEEPYRSRAIHLIRGQVGDVDGFVAVSEYCASLMSEYLRIPADRMHVAPLGINVAGYDRVSRRADGRRIGYFARITPEKGLHLLCEAYRLLRSEGLLPACRLEAAGYLAPEHKPYLDGIVRQMKEWGYDADFEYHGVVDREQKIRFLQSLDVLSVPSGYAEVKGIYLLEAMACGVPVVQPRHGAFPEVIERTGGGLLVEPNSPRSFAEGILAVLGNPAYAAELGRRGYEGVRRRYTVSHMAERVLEVYNAVSRPMARA